MSKDKEQEHIGIISFKSYHDPDDKGNTIVGSLDIDGDLEKDEVEKILEQFCSKYNIKPNEIRTWTKDELDRE